MRSVLPLAFVSVALLIATAVAFGLGYQEAQTWKVQAQQAQSEAADLTARLTAAESERADIVRARDRLQNSLSSTAADLTAAQQLNSELERQRTAAARESAALEAALSEAADKDAQQTLTIGNLRKSIARVRRLMVEEKQRAEKAATALNAAEERLKDVLTADQATELLAEAEQAEAAVKAAEAKAAASEEQLALFLGQYDDLTTDALAFTQLTLGEGTDPAAVLGDETAAEFAAFFAAIGLQ